MLKALFWDIDGTLLDFKAAERGAIPALFEQFELGECTDEMIRTYSAINERWWELLERGEDTKPNILTGRFREFFELYGIDTRLAPAFNKAYQEILGDFAAFIPGAEETVKALKGRYLQYAVTNGTKAAQRKKLRLTGLDKVFDGVFISEDVGFEKPDIRYFEAVLAATGITDPREALIIGDSLTSDMKGGCNAGLITCRYDPLGRTDDTDLPIGFTVTAIPDVLKVIGTLENA